MSDNLTYPEEAMRQARARIEALEAEKREYAAKYMAAAGQAGDALERADAAEAKLREAVEALRSLIAACDQGRMMPMPGSGVSGMTVDACIRSSIYTGVPAWPVEEARATLARLTGETQGD